MSDYPIIGDLLPRLVHHHRVYLSISRRFNSEIFGGLIFSATMVNGLLVVTYWPMQPGDTTMQAVTSTISFDSTDMERLDLTHSHRRWQLEGEFE